MFDNSSLVQGEVFFIHIKFDFMMSLGMRMLMELMMCYAELFPFCFLNQWPLAICRRLLSLLSNFVHKFPV